MFFFLKWVRILPEIDWYDYQGASPASNNDKDPYKLSVTSEPYKGYCPEFYLFSVTPPRSKFLILKMSDFMGGRINACLYNGEQ